MENRVADLELKLNVAEEAIEALDRTVYRQQQVIDSLQQQVRALAAQVQALADSSGRPGGSLFDELPPHY